MKALDRIPEFTVIACLAAALAGPTQAADTTLGISLQLPLESHIGENLVAFKQQVETDTGGAVAIDIYDAASRYRDDEVAAAVAGGEIEMGVVSLSRFESAIPAVDIFYQPFLFNTAEKVRAATAGDSTIRQSIDQAILETGVRVLWWQAYGGAIVVSNGGPASTPSDLAGKRVRVFGDTMADLVEAAGGEAQLISGSRQYQAYRDGTVDAGMTGVSTVSSRKLWEVMDTVTVTNHATIEFVVVVNETVWQSLHPETREIIRNAALAAELAVREDMAVIEAAAYDSARQHGMDIVTPSPAEIEQWKAIAGTVSDRYLERAGSLGAQLLEAARNL